MRNDSYNGWSNYETWVVNLWIDNEQSSQESMQDRALELLQKAIDKGCDLESVKNDATYELSQCIKDMHEENTPETVGVFADLLNAALGSVDWYEIAKHYIDDISIYSAGWNMPGYMPDSDLSLFIESSDAMDYIQEEMERTAESLSDGIDSECLSDDISHIPALIEALESVHNPDQNGEFGVTIGQYHYFISRV